MKNRIIIIGGGASGLVAAISAARQNNIVTILEHKDRAGKKLLSTGNGKCNLTNSNQKTKYYHCEDKNFIKEIFSQFDYKDTMDFFDGLGVYLRDKNGYIYPYSNQASSILEVLLLECKKLRVEIICNCKVDDVEPINGGKNGFTVLASSKKYACDKLILAAGSKAAPHTGSDGSGYKLLAKLSHHIIQPLPALTALRCSDEFCRLLSGIRTDGRISLYINGQSVSIEQGEIQLTDYGISGIPVFQVSRYASKALKDKMQVNAFIDFLPNMTFEDALVMFKNKVRACPEKTVAEQLIGVLNNKLSIVIIKEAKLSPKQPSKTLSEKEWNRFVKLIKNFRFSVASTNSYEQAQICCGGVDIDEVYASTLMSRLIDNLYLAGEILDVDGICGGYNLQWAWSTGYIAGYHAGNGADNDTYQSNKAKS